VVIAGGKLTGHNTDGSGWAWGLQRALPGADLSRVVLLGAGGAGSACAAAALRLGAHGLVIVDRDPGRAAKLASRMREFFPERKCNAEQDIRRAMEGASGLIHATPTGMAKIPGMPLPAELLRPGLWVSEIVYVPLETELLRNAKHAGCNIMDGGHMNVGQAIGAFRLFTGREAAADRMEKHFRSMDPKQASV